MLRFMLLLISGAGFACNNNTTNNDNSTDTGAATKINALRAISDSTSAAIDSSAHVKLDSIHAKDDAVNK